MTSKACNVRSCILGAAIVAVLIVGWIAMAPAQPVAVLVLPEASGTVSDVLVLPLDIQDVEGAEAIDIRVVFDSTVVRPDSLRLGDFGEQIQASWGANTIGDTLRIAFATVDGGYVGSGTLVTIEWELTGAGTSALHFERIVLERDDRGTRVELPARGDDGSVAVAPVAVETGTWGRVKHRFTRTP